MTDKELGNPENEPIKGDPEQSNESIENVESKIDQSDLHEDEVVVNEPIVSPSDKSVDVAEGVVIPHDSLNDNSSDNASAPVPPSNSNSKIWMGLSLVLAIVLVIVLIKPPFGNGSNEAVATVNGVKITKDKLYNQLVSLGGEQTLDNIITEELIEQEITKAKITITEEDINKEIDSIKKNFGSDDEFNSALTQTGMTMDDLKKEMEIQAKIRKLVEPQVKISDADIKAYFDENAASFNTEEQVRVSHILVETKEEAESILKELKGGADFATLASTKSKDTSSKDKGGDMDFFSRGQLGEETFENAAFALEKDQLSDVVQTSLGFHIIKATDHKDAHTATLEEKTAEIKELLTTQQVGTLSSTWLSELKEKADIKNTLSKEDVTETSTEETKTEETTTETGN